MCCDKEEAGGLPASASSEHATNVIHSQPAHSRCLGRCMKDIEEKEKGMEMFRMLSFSVCEESYLVD